MKEVFDRLIDFENGDLSDGEIVALFQELLESGLIDHLQGSYQRQCQLLLDAGVIEFK